MKLNKTYISIFIIIIIIFSGVLSVSAQNIDQSKVETNYINMNALTDSFNTEEKILSKKEIDTVVNESTEKFLIDVDSVDINHSAREVNITYSVNLSEGDAETLINSSLFNFMKSLNGFNYYDFNFDIYSKSVDKNYRTLKNKYGSYTFNRETLGSFNWEKIQVSNFISVADRIWTNTEGEQSINKEVKADELQLKILEIFKSYIQYKITEK